MRGQNHHLVKLLGRRRGGGGEKIKSCIIQLLCTLPFWSSGRFKHIGSSKTVMEIQKLRELGSNETLQNKGAKMTLKKLISP